MRRFLRDNGLSLCFGALCLLTIVGQSIAGHADFNARTRAAGGAPAGFLDYLTSSDFAVDIAENWQSEYLQFFLYIMATVWLVQLGSPESKHPGEIGPESDEKQLVGEHTRVDSPAWAKAGG